MIQPAIAMPKVRTQVTGVDFLNLERATWVEQPGAGQKDPSKPMQHGTTEIATSLNPDGSRRFTFHPKGGTAIVDPKTGAKTYHGYDNAFFGCHGLMAPAEGLIASIDDFHRFKTSDPKASQSIESETQANQKTGKINQAFGVNPFEPNTLTGKHGRYASYDYPSGGPWFPLDIPFDPAVLNDWVDTQMHTSFDWDKKQRTIEWIIINGKKYTLNLTEPFAHPADSARLDCNFQMGSVGIPKGAQYPPSFYVDVFRHLHIEFNNSVNVSDIQPDKSLNIQVSGTGA